MKDIKDLINDLQAAPVKPIQMLIGESIIKVVFDQYGKEGLRQYLSDPNYQFMMGSKAFKLAQKLMGAEENTRLNH